MNVLNLIRIALKALQRNKLRTFLTMLGVIIGVAAVITMMSIGEGSRQSIESNLSGMGTNMIVISPFSNTPGVRMAGASLQTLTLNDVIALRTKTRNLRAVSPLIASGGQAIRGALNWSTSMQGVSPEYLDIRKLSVNEGIPFSDSELRSSAKVCLLGQTVVDNLFPAGESPVGQIIRFKKIPFQVIGVLAPKGQSSFGQDQDDIIIAPYTTVQKRLVATNYFQTIYASATSQEASEAATAEITSILRQTHRLRDSEDNDFSVRTQAELIKTLNTTSAMLTALLTAVAGISLVIGGIGIMNIMYVSVTERTREIGLRMAIGARPLDILMQFLIEAMMISVTGGLIGVFLGIFASVSISRLLNWPTVISQSSILISFLVCSATGIFFGYYPALKASRLDPIDALRYE